LRLAEHSTAMIGDGDDGKIAFSSEPERKGMPKLSLLLAPLDALLRQDDLLSEAHLLDLTLGSGMAPIDGFFFDSGDSSRMNSRDRDGLGKNGEA
jgi:hypothetical protein